jgi:MOSC domain-containing protein YiiM
MQLLAISLSGRQTLSFGGRQAETGICKQPVQGPIQATALGLVGDTQVDLENHGGADKAIYAYTEENYRFWEQTLGRSLPYGQFGENLAAKGMPDAAVHIGDIFRIGAVECQVTQPRVPCYKLGLRMEDPGFVRRFRHSGRVGFYLRVLKEGALQAGDAIERLHEDPGQLSIQDAMLALDKNPRQQDIIRRALAIPALSQAWRDSLEKKKA